MLQKTPRQVLEQHVKPIICKYSADAELHCARLNLSVIFLTQAIGSRSIGSITDLDLEDFVGWLFENAEYGGKPICARRVNSHLENIRLLQDFVAGPVAIDA